MSKLQRAARHIGAVKSGVAQWYYWAHETDSFWRVSSDDLRELCDYIESDDPAIANDAYSHWCAGTSAEEMPRGWSPE